MILNRNLAEVFVKCITEVTADCFFMYFHIIDPIIREYIC